MRAERESIARSRLRFKSIGFGNAHVVEELFLIVV
jgi:hypothetical protein